MLFSESNFKVPMHGLSSAVRPCLKKKGRIEAFLSHRVLVQGVGFDFQQCINKRRGRGRIGKRRREEGEGKEQEQGEEREQGKEQEEEREAKGVGGGRKYDIGS